MRPQEIGIAERTEEIASRHVWLKSVLIDGNSFPTKIYRPRPTRRMSVTRRLENFTACERPSDNSDRGWQGSFLGHILAWVVAVTQHSRTENGI